MGRRTVSPEDDELIELGEDLVEWSEVQDDQHMRWCEWYTEQGFLRSEWDTMKKRKVFQWYYERAKKNLASKWLRGFVKEGIAQRFLWLYCPDLRAMEIEKMKIQNEMRKDQQEDDAETIANALNRLVEARDPEEG